VTAVVIVTDAAAAAQTHLLPDFKQNLISTGEPYMNGYKEGVL
jgi:hypothetical protein